MNKLQLINSSDPSTEPALKVGSIGTVATAVFILINAIWPNAIPDNVQTAITGLAVLLLPLIIAVIIRFKVWSPASVQEVLQIQQQKIAEKADTTQRLKPPPKLL